MATFLHVVRSKTTVYVECLPTISTVCYHGIDTILIEHVAAYTIMG